MPNCTQEMHFLFKGHLILPRGFICLFCSLQKQDTLQHRGYGSSGAPLSSTVPTPPSHVHAFPLTWSPSLVLNSDPDFYYTNTNPAF